MAYAKGKYAKFISDRSGMDHVFTKVNLNQKHHKNNHRNIHQMQNHYNFQDLLEQKVQLQHYLLVILLGLQLVVQQ